jgi:hypothetical protein
MQCMDLDKAKKRKKKKKEYFFRENLHPRNKENVEDRAPCIAMKLWKEKDHLNSISFSRYKGKSQDQIQRFEKFKKDSFHRSPKNIP